MEPDIYLKVFNNITLNIIIDSLSVEDLKSMRKVSKQFNDAINKSKTFYDKSRLIIGKDSLDIPESCDFRWKNIKVDVAQKHSGIKKCKWMFSQGIDIKFVLGNPSNRSNVSEIIQTVLTNSKNLKNLHIQFDIMKYDYTVMLRKQVIKNKMENLTSLKFFIPDTEDGTEVYYPTFNNENRPIAKNFQMLSEMNLKLKSFSLPKNDIYLFGESVYMRNILLLVRNCQTTLEDIHLSYSMWGNRLMQQITCPAIKNIVIHCNNFDQEKVASFVYKINELQSIKMDVKFGFTMIMYKALKDKSTNLKSIEIETTKLCEFTDDANWDFLKNIKGLQKFAFHQTPVLFDPYPFPGVATNIMTSLQVGIKCLELHGFQRIWNAAGPTRNDIPLQMQQTLVSKFLNITEMSLLKSINAIDDEKLQKICATLKKLKILRFSDCNDLHDFGLTGIDLNRNTGISIKTLKELTTLTVSRCPHVTGDGLVTALGTNTLRALTFETREIMMKIQIVKICKLNTGLNHLALRMTNLTHHYDVSVFKKQLQNHAPNLTQLKDLGNAEEKAFVLADTFQIGT